MKLNKFTFGVLLGTIIGLLTAPAKGEETRHKLTETAQSLKNRVREILGKNDSDLYELQSTLEDKSTELTDELRQKLVALVKRTRKNYEAIRDEELF